MKRVILICSLVLLSFSGFAGEKELLNPVTVLESFVETDSVTLVEVETKIEDDLYCTRTCYTTGGQRSCTAWSCTEIIELEEVDVTGER